MSESLIQRYYAAFNARRIPEASSLFNADAVLAHASFEQRFRGPDAYAQFVASWLQAFPDAQLKVERVGFKGDTIAEVDLIAEGTHCGQLQLGSYGSFERTGQRVALRVRELLELRGGKISYAAWSFDTHALVRQLVPIDYAELTIHLDRLDGLRQTLGRTVGADCRRTIADEIGRELDAARLVVRPWFRR